MSKRLYHQILVTNRELKEVVGDAKSEIEQIGDSKDYETMVIQIKGLLENLEDLVSSIMIADDNLSKLQQRMTAAERETENQLYDTFRHNPDSDFAETLNEARKIKNKLMGTKMKVEKEASKQNPPPISPLVQVSAPNLNLPSIDLPSFDGEIGAFNEFWDYFKFAVHDSNMIPAVKFSYLKKCLKGKALNTIEGLPVENKNYEIAINLLKEEFGKKEVIKNSLYNELQTIGPTNGQNADLRRFVDQTEKVLLRLEQTGESTEETLIRVTLQKKLPVKILSEIFEEETKLKPGEQFTTKHLRQKLKQILHRNEEVSRVYSQGKAENNPVRKLESSPPNRFNQHFRRLLPPNFRQSPSAHIDQTSTFHQNASQPIICSLCEKSGHYGSDCRTYPTRESRLQRLLQQNKCQKCTRRGHQEKDCRTYLRCYKCGQSHAVILCDQAFNGQRIPHNSSHATFTTTAVSSRRAAKNVRTQPHNWSVYGEAINANFTPLPPSPRWNPPTSNTTATSDTIETGQRNAENEVANAETFTTTATSQSTNKYSSNKTLFKCAEVKVYNVLKNVCQETLIMFDSGSSCTYVSNRLAERLKLPILHETTLQVSVFNSNERQETRTKVVPLIIGCIDGTTTMILGHTIETMTMPLPYCNVISNEVGKLKTDSIPLNWKIGTPDILIGIDFYHHFKFTAAEILPSGLAAVRSTLGWIISGRGRAQYAGMIPPPDKPTAFHSFTHDEGMPSAKLIEEFFNLESIGIKESGIENYEKSAIEKFQETLKFNGERYEVGFPWKETPPDLPSNYALSLGRLRSTFRQLQKKPQILEKYDQIIKEQLDLKIIEKVPNPTEPIRNPLHYLPHQPVVREDKGKVRVVYDASSKTSKQHNSLNDCLYSGPVLLEELAGVIMRFRMAPIAIAADLEKAFLGVAVRTEDRDCTRFLWLKNPTEPPNPNNIETYRFCRVAFGLTCSPFLLAAVLLFHLKQQKSKLATEIIPNLYVDNVLLVASSTEEGKNKCEEAKMLFEKAGMKLREFVSNDENTIRDLKDEEKLSGEIQKFLGMTWDVKTDNLFYPLNLSENDGSITKRIVLSKIATLFDPLGLLSPTLVKPKVFLQNLWNHSYKWDDQISPELKSEFERIIANMKYDEIKIPRRLSDLPLKTYKSELHGFSDASSQAFACCVYLKTTDRYNSTVNLIFSKSKVKPKKFGPNFSIHRMELLAAGIGVRALIFVKEQLKLFDSSLDIETLEPELNLWTDSSTVLHWLRASTKQDVFIENRLKVIRKIPNLVCRYVNTEDNPADIASRGCTVPELGDNKKWFKGPKWLEKPGNRWPIADGVPNFESKSWKPPEETETEEITLVSNGCISTDDMFMNPQKFSRWPKLLRVTAYVFRFIKLTLKRWREAKKFKISLSTVLPSISELRYAQNFWLKTAQKFNPPTDDTIRDLNLFEDKNNLIRSRGRIQKSKINENAIFPIYLPANSFIIHLLIYEYHLYGNHSFPNTTLCQIRNFGWIPKGRQTVKKIIRKFCIPCRKQKLKPFAVPREPELPENRVTPQPVPFEHSGVDYFGPLKIKTNSGPQKVWVCLFTCMVVRAVHMELVDSLSSEGFLNAFKRFTARRGLPKTLTSDNGTQFVLAAKALKQKIYDEWRNVFSEETFQNYFLTHGIKWKFITERAPWMGGFYERMIGLVKTHLRSCLSRSLWTADKLHTIIVEIERVINLRPITFVSQNADEVKPLRPADFLMPLTDRQFQPFIDGDDDDDNEYRPSPSRPDNLILIWEKMNQKIEKFYQKFQTDYLLALRERQIFRKQASEDRLPKIGELVLIQEDEKPRVYWQWGLVMELNPSEDGLIRTALVRLSSGTITRRALKHLYPLEAADEKL